MWFDAAQVSVTNGNKVVVVNSTESIANINPADALIVSAFSAVEIARAYTTDQGQFIELVKPWPNATQNTVPAYALPTSGDFNAAVKALKDASQIVHDNYQAMLDWQTKTGTVTFKDLDGNEHAVKTLKQRMSELEQIHPFPWAMRKVEFEARRQQNLEKYEASGFVHFGKHVNTSHLVAAVNEGLYTTATKPNQLVLGRDSAASSTIGDSKSDMPVLNMAGVITELNSISGASTYGAVVKLPPAEDGTRTYDSATGLSVRHATPALAFAAETETNKVVTDRVDAWGFESYLREINDSDPFVYKNGLPQSRATSINGVATTDDNVRPITYFAWYEGDDSSRGRGVNWQTATEAQRIAIASDPKINIYFDDATGKFYQQCALGRSFAGAGNGDWSSVDATGDAVMFQGKPVYKQVAAKGIQNDQPDYFSPSDEAAYYGAGHATPLTDCKGIFRAGKGGVIRSSVAVDGECYFLVCGTVNRLNQGAYHPSFNPHGAARICNELGRNAVKFDDNTARKITEKEQAFQRPSGGYPYTDGFVYPNTGLIGGIADFSGRPDGRFYDGICASGQGGVCRDMRYSANGLSIAELAARDLKVKSVEYRGHEKLQFTKVTTATGDSVESFSFPNHRGIAWYWSTDDAVKITEQYYVYNRDTGEIFDPLSLDLFASVHIATAPRHVYFPSSWGASPNILVIRSQEIPVSIAGEYLHTDIIGNSENILLCDDLKNGWIGGWIPELPDGTNKAYHLNKPILDDTVSVIYTDDNGASWGSADTSADPTTNSLTTTLQATAIRIWTYKTKAKTTKSASNSSVYGGKKGLGSVYAASSFSDARARGLGFSLTGNINTNSAYSAPTQNHSSDASLTDSLILDGKLSFYPSKHAPLSLGTPNNGSSAFKALNYVTVINGQAFICYAYAELIYDSVAGNWGDDGQAHIVDGQSTIIDLNGHTVKVGTAIIVEPLGWVKNAA